MNDTVMKFVVRKEVSHSNEVKQGKVRKRQVNQLEYA